MGQLQDHKALNTTKILVAIGPACLGAFSYVYYVSVMGAWKTPSLGFFKVCYRQGVTWVRRGLQNLWRMPRRGLPRKSSRKPNSCQRRQLRSRRL